MNKRIGFVLRGLKTEQFATFEEHYKANSKAKINLDTRLEYNFDKGNRLIGTFTTFTFQQNNKVFLKLSVSCHFSIDSESFESFCEADIIIFPKGFMAHLAMITVSSGRGVLHAKTEGTVFNKFLLPTIDVTQLVKEDISFDLES
ncbi:hypothetical protein [Mesonia sp. K4-1]|uniref:hypothetical protein n=1 Tax=Mesonia sp. K4-1 TaxID=2602760 RepID=UPI0011CB713C|nr:hypothetical protein [Mesonia sp. K4-1]TXK79447.1 hypothetical protein FT986_01020 [Mesonia sp. K4-1]